MSTPQDTTIVKRVPFSACVTAFSACCPAVYLGRLAHANTREAAYATVVYKRNPIYPES